MDHNLSTAQLIAKQGDNALGSVRLCVRFFALSRLNRLTYDLHLDFCMGVDLDLGQVGYVGQGRKLKVKVKCQRLCFYLAFTLL